MPREHAGPHDLTPNPWDELANCSPSTIAAVMGAPMPDDKRAEWVEPCSAANSILTPAGGGSDEPELSKTSGIAKDSPGGTQQPSPEGSPVDPALSSEADASEYEELQELRAANATLRKALDVRTEYHVFIQQRDEARIKATELGDILRELVYMLPRCDNHPDRPATRAWVRGAGRYCDECGTKVGMLPVHEYPRAAAVRKAVALIAKGNL
jgi:hypothetical protein